MCEELENIFVTVERDLWNKIFVVVVVKDVHVSKSEQPLNEVRVPQALPEYYIKYSQFENAKSDYLNRLSSKLSFEPSKPKGMSFYKIKEAF